MPHIPDNYDIWEAEERRKEHLLERLPECELCGEPIQQEDAVCLCGSWFCDDCLNSNRREIEVL